MRATFALFAALALWPMNSAHAFDKAQIAANCKTANKTIKDQKNCIARETSSARVVESLEKDVTSDLQRDILDSCKAVSGDSFILRHLCILEAIKRAESDRDAGIPAFDTHALCTKVRRTSGSYSYENQCRKAEAKAYREIGEYASKIDADIMAHCATVGRDAGGSYLYMRECIKQEIIAKVQVQ